jgi:hypothetical protein
MEVRAFGKVITNTAPTKKNVDFIDHSGKMSYKERQEMKRDLEFSHFSPRFTVNLSDVEVFATALNADATLLASSFQNG